MCFTKQWPAVKFMKKRWLKRFYAFIYKNYVLSCSIIRKKIRNHNFAIVFQTWYWTNKYCELAKKYLVYNYYVLVEKVRHYILNILIVKILNRLDDNYFAILWHKKLEKLRYVFCLPNIDLLPSNEWAKKRFKRFSSRLNKFINRKRGFMRGHH